jgi:acyl-CoA synthetase (NDP forming)
VTLTEETVITAARDLTPLFAPHSVAVVGASDDQAKYGNWIAIRALRGDRAVHLVNRSRTTVLGRSAAPSVSAIGERVDLVVIAVPAAAFEDAIEDALAGGARAIVGISGGLGETGAEGLARQTALAARVRGAGASLLGPNCLGVLDHSSGLELTSNDFPAGPVGLISQSGNLAIELSGLLTADGLGLSRFASVGNQADLEIADLIDSYVDHEPTRAIAIYCEDFRDGRRFARAAHRAYEAGKPVVLLAAGRSEASARGARSHTGSLVTSGAVVDAACAASGAESVGTPAEMARLLQALLRSRPPSGRRVAVFADGGGHAAIASDCVSAAGLTVDEFGPELTETLRGELPATAAVSNPVDVAGGGEQDITCFSRVTEHLLTAPETDAVLISGYFGGYGEYGPELGAGELAVAAELARVAGSGTVVVHTMRHRSAAADVLREQGVPVYPVVEDAVWALGRLAGRGERRPEGVPELPARAAAPLPEIGYFPAREMLIAAGLPFVPAERVTTLEELRAAAGRLRFPLVLKALGDDHKSDRGGVALNLADQAALEASWHDMQARLRPPACSVEEMADLRGAVELLVGVRRDPRFGPVVLVGLGGVHAEILKDTRCALGPTPPDVARRMLLDLRGAALLTGARGSDPIDVDAAAEVVARLSEVAAAHPELADLECNPVAARPDGAICLDARVVPA